MDQRTGDAGTVDPLVGSCQAQLAALRDGRVSCSVADVAQIS